MSAPAEHWTPPSVTRGEASAGGRCVAEPDLDDDRAPSRHVAEDWTQPDVTRGEAIAAGLYVAEWGTGEDFFRAYGRTEDEAIANVLAQRDECATLHVTTGRNDRDATGADWRQVAGPVIGRG